MRTGLHAQAVFGRKGIVKQVGNMDMKGKQWSLFKSESRNIRIMSLHSFIIPMSLLIIMVLKEPYAMSRLNKKYPGSSKY